MGSNVTLLLLAGASFVVSLTTFMESRMVLLASHRTVEEVVAIESNLADLYSSRLVSTEQSLGARSSETSCTLSDISLVRNLSLSVSQPTWLASFPGSGSELLRELVQASTGFATDEVYNRDTDCQDSSVIMCKTHWPLRIGGDARKWGAPPVARAPRFASDVFVLVRHPAEALPSFFNYKWEMQHHVQDHSQQGTEEEWNAWRDRRFDQDLENWKRLLRVWATQMTPYNVAHVIAYEDLVDGRKGPRLFQTITEHLQATVSRPIYGFDDPENAFNDNAVTQWTCLWKKIVQERAAKKRRTRGYQPSYHLRQKTALIRILQEAMDELSDYPLFLPILQRYKDDTERILVSQS